MQQRSFFAASTNKQPTDLPTIGILCVTMDGTLACMNKISEQMRSHFAGPHHPNFIYHQPNFGPIREAQKKGRWDIVEDLLVAAIEETLVMGGANFVIIPSNPQHKLIENIKKRVTVPIISMLNVVAAECHRLQWKKVSVLGANYLYQEQLDMHNIKEVTPTEEDQELIQRAMLEILMPAGVVRPQILDALLEVVQRLKERECEGIILACPKLASVLNKDSCRILPTLDTIAILVEKALQQAVSYRPSYEKETGLHASL